MCACVRNTPFGRPAAGERSHLRRHVRRRVEQIRAADRAIDQAEARDALGLAPPRADRSTQLLLAAELRNAGVLRDAEDDELPVGLGRAVVRWREERGTGGEDGSQKRCDAHVLCDLEAPSAGSQARCRMSCSLPGRSGGTGRRAGLKIPLPLRRVWVRFPPPAPSLTVVRSVPEASMAVNDHDRIVRDPKIVGGEAVILAAPASRSVRCSPAWRRAPLRKRFWRTFPRSLRLTCARRLHSPPPPLRKICPWQRRTSNGEDQTRREPGRTTGRGALTAWARTLTPWSLKAWLVATMMRSGWPLKSPAGSSSLKISTFPIFASSRRGPTRACCSFG